MVVVFCFWQVVDALCEQNPPPKRLHKGDEATGVNTMICVTACGFAQGRIESEGSMPTALR